MLEYEGRRDQIGLRGLWRKSLDFLVLEGRLDLLPRERGGDVEGSTFAACGAGVCVGVGDFGVFGVLV